MAATGRQFNWSAVTFTPTVGQAVTFNGVTSVSFDPGGSLASFSGDANKFPTLIINDMNAPTASVACANTAQVQGIAPGTVGVLTATHLDAKGATGGNMVYTLANAVVANSAASGAHRQFGTATITFQAFSTDGTTNPLSFALT